MCNSYKKEGKERSASQLFRHSRSFARTRADYLEHLEALI